MSSQNVTSSSIGNGVFTPGPSTNIAGGVDAVCAAKRTDETVQSNADRSYDPVVSTYAVSNPSDSSLAKQADGMTHEDADIQEYLNRLLKRTNGSPGPLPSSEKPAPVVELVVSPVETPVREYMDPTEFVPRTVAPERKKGLSALRELAMQSHHSAIQTSVRQRLHAKSLKHLIVLIAAIAFGGLFFVMSSRPFDGSMSAGLLCVLLAGPSLIHLVRRATARPMPNASAD